MGTSYAGGASSQLDIHRIHIQATGCGRSNSGLGQSDNEEHESCLNCSCSLHAIAFCSTKTTISPSSPFFRSFMSLLPTRCRPPRRQGSAGKSWRCGARSRPMMDGCSNRTSCWYPLMEHWRRIPNNNSQCHRRRDLLTEMCRRCGDFRLDELENILYSSS